MFSKAKTREMTIWARDALGRVDCGLRIVACDELSRLDFRFGNNLMV
jgi:hypothetical protein